LQRTGHRVHKPERLPYIRCEEEQENHGQIHEIPMNVLDDQRKLSFARCPPRGSLLHKPADRHIALCNSRDSSSR
jgi:hypothetical protein